MKSKNQLGILLICGFFLAVLWPVTAQDGAKLIESVWSQDFGRAKALVKSGADINYRDESSGSTALMLCCAYNFTDMGRFLIEHRPNLDVQDNNGRTALIVAAGSSEELFNLLLENGADPKIKTADGTTAFTAACIGVISGKISPDALRTLLAKGADVDESAASGPTAGYTSLMTAVRNGAPKLVRFLLDNGANVNARAKNGTTPLALAKQAENTEVIKLLQAAGAKE